MSFGNLTRTQAAMLQAAVRRIDVVEDILEECERQVKKWGVQEHPAFTHFDAIEHSETFSAELTTDLARGLCDFKSEDGKVSWNDIMLEEYMEARDEAMFGNEDALRVELVQLAAVIVSSIQDLDRRKRERDAGA